MFQTESEKKAPEVLKQEWKNLGSEVPKIHVVLGSGFGEALSPNGFPGWKTLGDIAFTQIPGLHASKVPDHKGCYRLLQHKSGISVSFQMGRLHGYEGYAPRIAIRPVMVPRLAGVKQFLLTNAAGGLVQDFGPGDAMVIRDQVNLTGQNPLTGSNPVGADGKELGPRFVDMTDLYDQKWQGTLTTKLKEQGLTVHSGVYLGLLGPNFETPAEVRLFAKWGLHAVGMSTVWEAIALRHSGAELAGLSLISNPGAGLTEEKLDHLKIVETCRASAGRIVKAVVAAIEAELL